MLGKFTKSRLNVEQLEDRLVPSATVVDVDLTTRGAVGSANGAIFRQYDAQPTGTGVIDSFVRLQAQGAKTTMQHGFNTDGTLQFDENKSRQFTRAIQLGQVPEVNIGGTLYKEFLLDINQKANQPYLSLDELRIFLGSGPNISGYDTVSHRLAGIEAAFDLDAGGDHGVKLDARLNQGSGKGDMLLYVPVSAFGGAGPNEYLYLYSKFGVTFTSNAGFEEWAFAKSSLACDNNTISGTVRDQDGNAMVDVVLFLDTNDNGTLDNNEVYTTTNSAGQYFFNNLASGVGEFSTYTIREVTPEGYTQQGPEATTVSLDHCLTYPITVDLVNVKNEEPPPPPPPPPSGAPTLPGT